VTTALNEHERSVKGSKILVLGVAYKRDIDDPRESPALDIIELLVKHGANVQYHDPYISTVSIGDKTFESVKLTDEILASQHATVIATDHTDVDYERVVKLSKLVVDTRNATAKIGHRENIVKL